MNERDWQQAWELFNKFKKDVAKEKNFTGEKLIEAVGRLLNKQDPDGLLLFKELLMERVYVNFYQKYWEKVQDYRLWFEERVELADVNHKDLDLDLRKAFYEQHNQA